MKAHGWVVIERGEILVKTVQDSRIGAMVNYLGIYGGVIPHAGMSDKTVEALFEKLASRIGCAVVATTITCKERVSR